jgi:hypothetical protein
MQLNDFPQWIRNNITVIIIAFAASLTVSVVVGSLIGNAAKKRAGTPAVSVGDVGGSALTPEPSLLLPEPVVPSMTDSSPYSFYFDADYYDIDEEELIPVSFSEMLQSGSFGEDIGIKPFSLRGTELEVLTVTDELSEP